MSTYTTCMKGEFQLLSSFLEQDLDRQVVATIPLSFLRCQTQVDSLGMD